MKKRNSFTLKVFELIDFGVSTLSPVKNNIIIRKTSTHTQWMSNNRCQTKVCKSIEMWNCVVILGKYCSINEAIFNARLVWFLYKDIYLLEIVLSMQYNCAMFNNDKFMTTIKREMKCYIPNIQYTIDQKPGSELNQTMNCSILTQKISKPMSEMVGKRTEKSPRFSAVQCNTQLLPHESIAISKSESALTFKSRFNHVQKTKHNVPYIEHRNIAMRRTQLLYVHERLNIWKK